MSYGDSTGELASYRFEYDSLGRLIRSAELDADGGTVQRTEHIYDGYNRLSRQSWTLGDKTYSESYVYDDPSDTNKNGDGALTQMTTATGAVIDYQYDTLRRLTRSKVALNGSTVYTTAYAFRDLDASRTTTQVQYRNVRSANGEVLEGKKYTYDALGNITRISRSTGHFYPLVAYEYDAQNQLVKETYYNGKGSAAGNISRTISYTYDTAGNILSETRTEDGETTTKTYGYGDSDWADLLTAVNGLSITYDASGNPETYYTGSVDRRGNAEVYDMYWGNGRQLTDVETDDGQTRSRISYGYDADGIRSWKAVDGEIHTYLTQGGKVMRETVGSTVMDFAYDESGRPFAMTYQSANEDPQTYYYVLNLQGDVVKLVTASGTEAASYAYDAWGNLLSATGSMAYTNPLRYRGYYHDAETRFYYLQSRYYDPVYHRFINADSYASTGQGFVGTNMFAYCNNNPVMASDPTGKLLTEILVGIGMIFGTGLLLSGCSARNNTVVLSNKEKKWMSSSKTMGKNLAKAADSSGHRVQAITTDSFSEIWSNITENYVAIHTHGSPDGLFGDDLSIRTDALSKIDKNPNIKCIIITACETGGQNGEKSNVGQVLSTKIAPDGYVVCSTTVVGGEATTFTATDLGTWQVYQRGVLVSTLPESEITMESVFSFLYGN